MKIIVTGASGFIGGAFIKKLADQGSTVYGLSRHPPEPSENVVSLPGDITQPDLGLEEVPKDIDAIYHLAAIHHLGNRLNKEIWETNVIGTENVIKFCQKYKVPGLYFCSTAYTIGEGRNTYEKSKIMCEEMVQESGIPHITIFKPSVVMGTKDNPYPGHFSQFVSLLIKVHRRAELIRRKIEGTLRLPVLEPVFRVKGNPDGRLNLVLIDEVVKAMVRIKGEGIYWLTNPNPPTLQELFNWIGEVIRVNLRFEQGFKATPLEEVFHREVRAFSPYLQGDNFSSHLKNHPMITRDFIHETVANVIPLPTLTNVDK